MNKLNVTISSPDGTFFDGEAVSLSVRGADGDLAILAGHTPFVTSVKAGECVILTDDDELDLRVGTGLLTVDGKSAVLLTESVTTEGNF